jgi:hypothetical protein
LVPQNNEKLPSSIRMHEIIYYSNTMHVSDSDER